MIKAVSSKPQELIGKKGTAWTKSTNKEYQDVGLTFLQSTKQIKTSHKISLNLMIKKNTHTYIYNILYK